MSAEPAEVVAAVPLTEALPAWRLSLYQPAGLSPRGAVDRQVMLFTVAFGLLLLVIATGLARATASQGSRTPSFGSGVRQTRRSRKLKRRSSSC
jgi:hypothetical protein